MILLLSADYEKIVRETFKIEVYDIRNYYQNIINNHISITINFIDNLILAINDYYNGYCDDALEQVGWDVWIRTLNRDSLILENPSKWFGKKSLNGTFFHDQFDLLNEFKKQVDAHQEQVRLEKTNKEITLTQSLIPNWYEADKLSSRIKAFSELVVKQNKDLSIADENFDKFIFASFKAYGIFIEMKNKIVRTRYPVADYSFLYWMLKENKIINNITPTIYKQYIEEHHFTGRLSKIKVLEKCTTNSKQDQFRIIFGEKI